MLRISYNLILRVVVVGFSATTIGSCIKNDIPLPEQKGVFLEFEAEGQKRAATINEMNRTVVVDFLETVNLKQVNLSKVTLKEGVCDFGAGDQIDLSSPIKTIIKTRGEYEWTISATQTIDRRFLVEDQVGESSFEEHTRSVFAYVSTSVDLTKVNILQLKLGPEGKTNMAPALSGVVSFRESTSGDETRVREVEVKYFDVIETWSLYVTKTETRLYVADIFARRVHLLGYGQEGLDNGFEYRLAENYDQGAGQQEEGEEPENGWTRVGEEMMEYDGGVFKAVLTGLEPETQYVARAFSGKSFSGEDRFTTEGTRSLPDGSFDVWHLDKKLWNPWTKDGTQWWDTGNKGAATLGSSNSTPTEAGEGCPSNPSGKAAYLETRFVGTGGLGKIAGGNIYFGKYGKTVGTNGLCDIGRPWQHKPTKAKGYYKYFPKPITDVGDLQQNQKDHFMGSTDSLNICVALWASPDGRTIPFTVNTSPTEFVDFARDAPGVIAYGAFANPNEQSKWGEFSIDLEYFNTGELPENTVLFIMATSSKNCNYFTAGRGSLLYLDEMELVYD